MCTNASTYLVVKMKFISQIAVGFYRGVSSLKLPVVTNNYTSGFDVAVASVVIEAIVWPLSCTQ